MQRFSSNTEAYLSSLRCALLNPLLIQTLSDHTSTYSKMALFHGITLIFVIQFGLAFGCIFRATWNIFASDSDKESSNGSANNILSLDKETVSVVEQTVVKALIKMGKLKFHCPEENGVFTDQLDCSKFYICTNFNFTEEYCDPGTGYEPLAKTCINSESVPLCQKVQKLKDYNCTDTGLHIYDGQCEKFILCTDEAAFASSCNQGDLFHQKLKLCLPEDEVNCTSIAKSDLKENEIL